MKKFLFFSALIIGGWFYFHDTPAKWRGMPAAAEPIQTSNNLPAPFLHGSYTITPLARYKITAITLSRDRYRFDPGAPISPVDLALGWGPMSVASVINDLSIRQSGRWYEYSYASEPPLDPDAIASHSANTHCLPATDEIRTKLLAVKRHQVVSMEGYLVEVTGANGYHWRSSLSRTDTGGGACEVFWITHLDSRSVVARTGR